MNLSQQLSEFDKQVAKRRQQIAVLQVEIAQIEDARRTLIFLEEQRAEQTGGLTEHQRAVLNGRSDKPLMIVRQATREDDGTASREAKYGKTNESPEAAQRRKDRDRERHRKDREAKRLLKQTDPNRVERLTRAKREGRQSMVGSWKDKVLRYLSDASEPATPREIANYYGLPSGEGHRKGLGNAIYQLKVKGAIKLVSGGGVGHAGSYMIAERANGHAEAH